MNEVLNPEENKGIIVPSTGNARGFEAGYDKEDLIMPRAKLLQALSPEIADEEIEGLKAGLLINSLTKEVLQGAFIPVMKLTDTWIRFNPRSKDDPNFVDGTEPGAMIWKSQDPLDARVQEEGQWNGDTPPVATKFMNFFCLFENEPSPVIVSFANTSYKAGKRLLSLGRLSGQDMFARKYGLASIKETNDKGTYFVLNVKPLGNVTEDEYKIAESVWSEYSAKTQEIKIHDEGGDQGASTDDKNTDDIPF